MCDFLYVLCVWMFRHLCVKNWMEFCFAFCVNPFPKSGEPRARKPIDRVFLRELSCDLTTVIFFSLCRGKSCCDYFCFALLLVKLA